MIDPALRASLAAFDDATLTTLANPGLVRRAQRDIEEGRLRLVSADEGTIAVEADGHLVTLDTRGPRASSCTCKSAAVCRHRIAAVLFVRSVEETVAVEAEGSGAPEEIVSALDTAALERWAGKASWRAALELLETATRVEPLANAIAISFVGLEEPVRILRGQSFDGIVSKAAKAQAKAYHAAAVLAARQYFGAPLPTISENGTDAAPDAVEVDLAFLDRVAASLCEVVMLGFSLAPLPLEEALFELSVSSRADSLPRLAALLRAIAAQIRLRRQHALSFDPDRMLELAASAYVLTCALAKVDAERRSRLAGRVRRDFAPSGPLNLIGCGGERWTTETGARGVTAWFVDLDTGRWLSTTLARGAGQDPDFKPGEAWRTHPMWQAEPLAVLAHARIKLEGVRRSADDRLSASANARATIAERDVEPDPAWPGVIREWRDLRSVWLRQSGLGIEGMEGPAACLLAPSAIATPYFEDLSQQLVWPVRDASGEWLALTLDHHELTAAAIEALEANVRGGWRGMLLVRLMRTGDALEAQPVTLFGPGGAVDLTLWQRPSSNARGRGAVAFQDWLARFAGNGARRFARFPRVGTDAVLAAAWQQLLDDAETSAALRHASRLAPDRGNSIHAERLDSHGLATLANLMRAADSAAGILAAAYGLLVARQQRAGAPLIR